MKKTEKRLALFGILVVVNVILAAILGIILSVGIQGSNDFPLIVISIVIAMILGITIAFMSLTLLNENDIKKHLNKYYGEE